MESFFDFSDLYDEYDVIILGAGPAGLTAGIYAARDNLKTLILEKNFPGGQVAITEVIENYPGFEEGISGGDLTEKMFKHAKSFGVQIKNGICSELKLEGKYKCISTQSGAIKDLKSKAIIIATGANPRHMGVKNENKFLGRGISFCATCDANFYRGKEVAVVGGGDSAVEEANYLTKFCNKVTIVHRRDKLRATKILQERAFKNPKIEFVWNADIQEVKGDKTVEGLIYKDKVTGEIKELNVNGIFVFVGWLAATDQFKGLLDMDESGFIKTNLKMETKIPGVYVAGDVRVKDLRQVVTAVSDGAIAAKQVSKYIENTFEE